MPSENLIARMPTRYIMISYNDESIVKQPDLLEICNELDVHKNITPITISYRRNIMSQIGNVKKNDVNSEDEPEKNQKNKELSFIINKMF